MKIAISQPRYLPSCNYIERILLSDLFVMLDVVQHQKRAFEHRNKIRTPDGWIWLSIPMNREKSYPIIKDLKISNDTDWLNSHLRSFELYYKKTPFYNTTISLLRKYYETSKDTLNQAVKEMLDILLDYFNINTKIIWTSEYDCWTKKNDELLLEIVEKFNGTSYISGSNGRNYIDKNKFNNKNIKLLFHDYNHPTYDQIWGEFIPYMTIWDTMFYYGKDTLNLIKKGKLNEK